MKRVILTLVVLVGIVATIGFANTFTINQSPNQENLEDISSGMALVDSPNENVVVDIIHGPYRDALDDWKVGSVWVNVWNQDYDGQTVYVQLTDLSGFALGATATGTLSKAGSHSCVATVDFCTQEIPVGEVGDVHVMVDFGPTPAAP